MSILEGSLAADVTDALEAADVPYGLVLNKRTVGTPDPPWEPPPVSWVPHACRGWRDAYTLDTVDGSVIQATDVRIVILATSLAIVPTTSDTITLDGATFIVVNIKRDPAGATWELQARS